MRRFLSSMRSRREPNFAALAFLLFLILVVSPLILDFKGGGIIIQCLFSIVLVTSCYMLTGCGRILRGGVALAIPTFIFGWLVRFDYSFFLAVLASGTELLFIIFITWNLGSALFRMRKISANTVHGSLCVYVLLGILWADIYILTELFIPGSFEGTLTVTSNVHDPANVLAKWQSFYYLSFVTLSTLGFGDLVPLSAPARSIAIAETIAGQFYLATYVARVIGMYLLQMEKDIERDIKRELDERSRSSSLRPGLLP